MRDSATRLKGTSVGRLSCWQKTKHLQTVPKIVQGVGVHVISQNHQRHQTAAQPPVRQRHCPQTEGTNSAELEAKASAFTVMHWFAPTTGIKETLFKTLLPLNLHYKILVKTPNLVTTFTPLTIHPCGLLAKQNLITSERDATVDGKRKDIADTDEALKSSLTSPTKAATAK
ncbi:hypothetical protein ON010_g992 [Phytophthora cinnamomi]|nr:hypothetical protein ON010_g992 [Phytophthora cinnamomi]